ncbi:hypothetical protein [Ileibacterium valens]|uniref:hypothetical protein n=1 Tax=Ileibacterium valens TaxID=1862668 RepID=UPI002731A598|nr:hypothetical protein [Ileibacterium valens]
MTRQERRRLGRETVTMTKDELKDFRIKALDEGFCLAMAVPVIILKEEFGWGAKTRIPSFVDKSLRKYLDLQAGRLSMDEIVAKVNEYTGKRLKYGNDLKEFEDQA